MTYPVCPICKEYPIQPRLYECGHTTCEQCMKMNDKITQETVIRPHSIKCFSCPICRSKSLKPWRSRPINRDLREILITNVDDYKEKHEQYIQDNPPTILDDVYDFEDSDFSRLCNQNRKRIALELYEDIIPLIHKAALDGKPYILLSVIQTPSILNVIDLLSKMLFMNHNIYRITCTTRDCTISLIDCAPGQIINEYINDEYSDNPD